MANGTHDAGPEQSGSAEDRSQPSQRLDTIYKVLDHCYATRTSDAYRAFELDSNRAVLLWRLRYPIELHSDSQQRFLRRMERIQGLSAPVASVQSYGVDRDGIAYLATDFTQGKPLFESRGDVNELARLFLSALRAVSCFHRADLIFGDICAASFTMDGDGDVTLQGLLGAFEIDAKNTALLPSGETLHFVSPEQRSGSAVLPATDVYALGVFGYRLFTGRYPYGSKLPPVGANEDEHIVPAPTSLRSELPMWVDDILGKCLVPQSEFRFADATSLADEFQYALTNGSARVTGGRWSNRTLIVKPDTLRKVRKGEGSTEIVTVQEEPSVIAPEGREPRAQSSRAPFVIFVALVTVIGLLGAVAIFLFVGGNQSSRGSFEEELSVHEEVAPGHLRSPMELIVSTKAPLEKRREALALIAASDDPVAYAVLVSTVKRAPIAELRLAAEDAIIERIRRQGLERSAKVVGDWLRAMRNAQRDPTASPAYMPLLNACNTALPIDRRRFSLNQAYAVDANASLQLAAALSFDDKESGNFLPVLRQLLAAQLGREDLEGKNIGALVLAHPTLSQVFSEESKTAISEFSNEDLAWVLVQLASSNSRGLTFVAREALNRNVVPPFQAVFLKVMVENDPQMLPYDVRTALVRGARGEFSISDVIALGRWLNLSAEPALLAVCALANDDDVGYAAFDTLSARTLENELVTTFLDPIKAKFWAQRKKFIKPIGIIGHSEIATLEQVQFAFDVLIPYVGVEHIFRLLSTSKDEQLVLTILDRFSKVIPSENLVELLSHPSKKVRSVAVQALEGSNELSVLQSILQAYNKEKDEEVRALYRKLHWVTAERENAP